MARIEPMTDPYPDGVGERLAAMMPAGVPPIGLFRTLVHNLSMTDAMGTWGGYELSKQLSLTMRDREILIDRTCARCRCEYEWGVHITFFAERVGLDDAQVTSLTHGGADDACWTDGRDRLLVEAADALHDDATLTDDLWTRLSAEFDRAQILDLLLLCGWYHAISYAANGAGVELEDGAPRFADVSAEVRPMVYEPIEMHPIGHVESALRARDEAPKQADEGAPSAWIVVDDDHVGGLLGVDPGNDILVLTWLHQAERDVHRVHSRGDRSRPETGVFSVRSPVRPNPIGLHRATVLEVTGGRVRVEHLEAIDGTPVLDLKPVLGDER